MVKQINYVLIAEGLTGDSEVLFFPTPELAKAKFDELVNPFKSIIKDLSEDEIEELIFSDDVHRIRIYTGVNEQADALLNDCDRFITWESIYIDEYATHYIAELSEWVDESNISFYPKDIAIIKYNDLIDESIQIAKDHHGIEINRYDQSTWQTENGTVFTEAIDTTINHSDAFFGYSDVYYTYRIGEILQ